jgi:hypothetical protein
MLPAMGSTAPAVCLSRPFMLHELTLKAHEYSHKLLMLVLMLKVLKDHPAFDETLRKAFASAMEHLHH